LIGKLARAADGQAIYRKSSFLVDKIGEMVANKEITIIDDPHMPGRIGSRPWGTEGLKISKRTIVGEGRLEQFFLDGYAARKLETLPNGGAQSNLYLQPGKHSPEEIIRSVKNGLYLTGISGMGFNPVTGDYSLGASGLWIENGELIYAVDEITIASTMIEMLNAIEAVGNDLEFRSSVSAPTLLVGRMTIGGK
jgi:PmbA protein